MSVALEWFGRRRHSISGAGLQLLVAGWVILAGLAIPGSSSSADDHGGLSGRTLYISIEVAKYWNGAEASALKEISAAHPVVISSLAAGLYSRTGLSPEVIERVQIALYRELGGEILAIRGVHAIERSAVISKLTPGAREETIAGYTCYTSDTSGLMLVPIDDRDVLFGRTKVVRALVEHGRAGRELLWLSRASAEDAPLLTIEIDPAWFAALARQPQAGAYRPLFEAESWRLTASVGKGLDVRLAVVVSRTTIPADAEIALRKALGELDGYLVTAGEEMPKMLATAQEKFPQAEKLIEPFRKALAAARGALEKPVFEQKGDEVAVTLYVETEQPAATAVLLLSLLPRTKKPAP